MSEDNQIIPDSQLDLLRKLTDDQLLEAIGEMQAWAIANESATIAEQTAELERLVARLQS